jgi:hypothetical protein
MAHVSHGVPLRMEKPIRQRKRLGQAGGGLPSTGVQALSERPRQPYKSGLAQRVLLGREKRITGRKTTGSFWYARRVPETKGRVQRKAVFSKTAFRWTRKSCCGESATPVVMWRKTDDKRLQPLAQTGVYENVVLRQ